MQKQRHEREPEFKSGYEYDETLEDETCDYRGRPLPDPPDNLELFLSLPESLRAAVARRFEIGIYNGCAINDIERERVKVAGRAVLARGRARRVVAEALEHNTRIAVERLQRKDRELRNEILDLARRRVR